MSVEAIIAIISTAISLLAVVVSFYTFHRSLKASSKPVLIFSLRSEALWQLQNVGNGPAVNVLVGEMNVNRDWVNITNCYPLAAGASVPLSWLRHGVELAAVYTDVYGGSFTTHCASNWNAVSSRNEFPGWRPENHEVIQVIMAKGRKLISEKELEGMTAFELDIKRNEIYARHGYIFKRADLKAFFEKQSWYKASVNDKGSVEEMLSEDERAMARYIWQYQKQKGLLTHK